MTDAAYEVAADEGFDVTLPSGATFKVLTEGERDYVTERVRRYTTDNHFINVSDFQDVDRMIMLELFVQRWGLWLSFGKDYFLEPINEKDLAAQIATYSHEVRQLKKNLGVDKVARDRARGDDSWPKYHERLLQRAREFGYMRNRQFAMAIELFQQMSALITLYDNCDDIERRENHVTKDDVFDWLRTVAIPAFEAIDEEFIQNEQRMWIRQM